MAVKKSTWIGGTVFVGLVVCAGAYFLAIAPTMAATSELRDQTEQTVAANEIQEVAVAKLAADFAKIDEYKAALAGVHEQVPTTDQLAEYLLSLDAIAVAHSVTLVSVSPGTAAMLAAPVAPAPAPVPTEGAESDAPPAEGVDATVPVTPEVATGAASLAAIPFSITVVGTYDNTLAFLWDVQNSKRLMLVTGLSATALKEGSGGAGLPPAADGDQQIVITGQTYVMPDMMGVPVDPGAAPLPLPGAVPGKNPMVPLAGA